MGCWGVGGIVRCWTVWGVAMWVVLGVWVVVWGVDMWVVV